MGCDIHLHIELQKDSGEWVHYAAPFIARDYALFERMAGVRGSVMVAISPPKGLPDDLSLVTKVSWSRWKRDAHSMSWLSSEEIMKLEDWLKPQDLEWNILRCFLFENGFTSFKKYDDIEYLPKPFTDVRFVFWFDN